MAGRQTPDGVTTNRPFHPGQGLLALARATHYRQFFLYGQPRSVSSFCYCSSAWIHTAGVP